MATYSEQQLVEKLAKLSNTPQSIETLSHWLMFHTRHAKSSVQTWIGEMKKTPPDRKLVLLYLANDVLQNSRRKGSEFVDAFTPILPPAVEHAYRTSPEEIRGKILRLLKIWEERQVYDKTFLEGIRGRCQKATPKGSATPPAADSHDQNDVLPASKTSSKPPKPASLATTDLLPNEPTRDVARLKELSMLLLEQIRQFGELDVTTVGPWRAFETALQDRQNRQPNEFDANMDERDLLSSETLATLDLLLVDQEIHLAKQMHTCELTLKITREKAEQCERRRTMVHSVQEGRPVPFTAETASTLILPPHLLLNRGDKNQNYPESSSISLSRPQISPIMQGFPPPMLPHLQSPLPLSPTQQANPFGPFPPPPPPRGPPPPNQPRLHNAFSPPQPLPPGTASYVHPYAPASLVSQPSVPRPDRSSFTATPPPPEETAYDTQLPPSKRQRTQSMPSRPTAAELWRRGRDAEGDMMGSGTKKRKNDDIWLDEDRWRTDESGDIHATLESKRGNFARSSHGGYSNTSAANEARLIENGRRTSSESVESGLRVRESRTAVAGRGGARRGGRIEDEKLARVAAWVQGAAVGTKNGDEGWHEEDGWEGEEEKGEQEQEDDVEVVQMQEDRRGGERELTLGADRPKSSLSYSSSRSSSIERYTKCDVRDDEVRSNSERTGSEEESGRRRESRKEENRNRRGVKGREEEEDVVGVVGKGEVGGAR